MIVENTKEDTRVVKYTIYTCSDGKTFTYKDDAENYEKYLNAKEIVKNLKCRTDNFVGFEKYYDITYYCSSKEEFDAVCIVIRYEDVNLRYVDADLYLAYDSETYEDEGWYYFKTKEDYFDDYDYNWRIFICSLNTKRNDIQKQFDKAKKELDAFNEKYSQYIIH